MTATIIQAIIPIFILGMLGNIARRSGFLDEEFWQQAERATYYVLLPALFVLRLVDAEIVWSTQVGLIAAAVLLVLLGTASSFATRKLASIPDADFSSFLQGNIRFNAFIGLAICVNLPAPALALSALLLAAMIPLVNVICVLVFSLFSDTKINWKNNLLAVAKNPLILSCIMGIILNVAGFEFPSIPHKVLELLSQLALPIGLLAVGAALRLQALKSAASSFVISSVLKLSTMPMIAYGLATVFSLSPVASTVLIIFAGLPTATSSYILARQLGGNAELMAAIITGQTLLSMLSLPLVMRLLL